VRAARPPTMARGIIYKGLDVFIINGGQERS
jgi:hypothetical protein